MKPIEPIPLASIREARQRLTGLAIRTPLLKLNAEDDSSEIYLKLENLQPIGSFKLRGAGNVMARATREALKDGVYTASAGNMAQGVAWVARKMDIPCRVVVPDHAPDTKLDAIKRLGAETIKLPFSQWWDILLTHRYDGCSGLFVHPVSHPDVIAGNATIGLEILEDLPEVQTVIVPFGGGGLSSGIASALAALKPEVKVYASEVETAAPLAASLAAGEPLAIDYTPSFVDGIGGKSMLTEMWPLVRTLLSGSIVVSLEEIASAIRLLIQRNQVVAEGAGASSVAAALSSRYEEQGPTVCVVSGGNIDTGTLARILEGEIP